MPGLWRLHSKRQWMDLRDQFGVNHLGPFLFTILIVRKLSRDGRIVNISSSAYTFGGVRFDDLNFEVSVSSITEA